MMDLRSIRENPQKYKEACRKKAVKADIDGILRLDERRRTLLSEIEEVRAKKNRANEEIKDADEKKKKEIIERMRKIDKENEGKEEELKEVKRELDVKLREVPNPPLEEVPFGESDDDNKVLREEGKKADFRFSPKDYLEIAENLGIIDMKRAAKTSGARFGIIKGKGVLLHFALVNLAFDVACRYGFMPVLPPVMLKPEMMEGMGYVERGGDEIYHLEKDDLYLIGTSEQIIGPMHSGEIMKKEELPLRYIGYSSCFRREAGSHGKDTRGILRVHQFEKVEMFSFARPEDSPEEHELLLRIEEELMNLLEIPYRVVDICTADLGDPAAKKYDIEAWMPGQGEYRETHSTSNCTDFQARRLNIRYREKDTTRFLHTLNGTALAIGRTMIALIENNQREDGSVVIPEALNDYLPFKEIAKDED